MHKRTTLLVAGVAVVALAVGLAAAGGDSDEPITGDAYDRASAAALEATGEGRVTDTEVGDEEGYYEVEVTLEDGRQVDVHLDEDFTVVGDEADEETDDAGGDD